MNRSGEEALDRLIAGNARYTGGAAERPNQNRERRRETAGGQHPFAAVLTCSDSRVPPEIIFDCGIGDIFVVRVAGNTAGGAVIGSIEYAALHLGVPLILVLGHTDCGAVKAAIAAAEAPGRIGALLADVSEAVARSRIMPGERVDVAVRENVSLVVDRLRGCEPVLAPLVARGALTIAGAVYDVVSGSVKIA